MSQYWLVELNMRKYLWIEHSGGCNNRESQPMVGVDSQKRSGDCEPVFEDLDVEVEQVADIEVAVVIKVEPETEAEAEIEPETVVVAEAEIVAGAGTEIEAEPKEQHNY